MDDMPDWLKEADESEYFIDYNKQSMLLSLLNTTTFGKDETGAEIEGRILAGILNQDYEELKLYLLQNQLDPITHIGNYNQTDINKHLKKLK